MRLDGLARDVWLPAGLVGLGTLELVLAHPMQWPVAVVLTVLAGFALVFRRRFSLVAPTLCGLLITAPGFVNDELTEPATPLLFIVVSFYSLARWNATVLGGVIGGAVIIFQTGVYFIAVSPDPQDVTNLVFVLSFVVPPFALGRLTRRLDEQSEQLREQQPLLEAAAVRAERQRIARELHDVIAHSVSAMVVQTAAAQDLVRSDPDRAEAILADVADTGRRALTETGHLLHAVRDEDDELGLAPAPGLADVPELVDRFRADGLKVDLDLTEPLPTLPAGVDVSAYRLVQEALTNALKYATDRRASLTVAAAGSGIGIQATNAADGRTGSGSGLGLVGMAERVSLLGGTLAYGVTAAGRFELSATLPGADS